MKTELGRPRFRSRQANWTGILRTGVEPADSINFFFFLHSIKTTLFWKVYRLPESLETGNPCYHNPPLAAVVGVLLRLPLMCGGLWHPDDIHGQSLQASNLRLWKPTKLFPVPHNIGSRQSSLLLLIDKVGIGRRLRLVPLPAVGRCYQNLRIY